MQVFTNNQPQVFDNIFPEFLVEDFNNKVLNESYFPFYYKNNITNPNPNFYFPGVTHAGLSETEPHTEFNYNRTSTNYSSYLNQFLYYFCFSQQLIIEDIYQSRLFINFPLREIHYKTHIHTDMTKPHLVFLYYVNDVDGDTIFFDDNNKEIQRVSPKKGRVLFFDGSLKHTGTFPTQNSRAVLNINFLAKKLG